jgi:lysyl-tRNA synthetase class I
MSYPICPKCEKPMRVRTSERVNDSQVRYHKCACGYKATRIVPAASVWRRLYRTSRSADV